MNPNRTGVMFGTPQKRLAAGCTFTWLVLAVAAWAHAQDVLIQDFQPRSMLKNNRHTPLTQARFPVIDVHTHFRLRQRGDEDALEQFVATSPDHVHIAAPREVAQVIAWLCTEAADLVTGNVLRLR